METKTGNSEEATLIITGMTCAACSNRVEKGLNKLNGISQANVNLTLETAHVEFEADQISISDMIRKVSSLVIKRLKNPKVWTAENSVGWS